MSKTPGSHLIPISKPGRHRGQQVTLGEQDQTITFPITDTEEGGEYEIEEAMEMVRKLRQEGKVVEMSLVVKGEQEEVEKAVSRLVQAKALGR